MLTYMVFWVAASGVTHSKPITGEGAYWRALEIASGGPSGSQYQISDITTDNYKTVSEGWVS